MLRRSLVPLVKTRGARIRRALDISRFPPRRPPPCGRVRDADRAIPHRGIGAISGEREEEMRAWIPDVSHDNSSSPALPRHVRQSTLAKISSCVIPQWPIRDLSPWKPVVRMEDNTASLEFGGWDRGVVSPADQAIVRHICANNVSFSTTGYRRERSKSIVAHGMHFDQNVMLT
jgi:hypothetical protein